MNRERLTILRDHLASLPDERVMMAYFFAQGGLQYPSSEAVTSEILHNCGTAACIAGWAAHLFRSEIPGVFADDVAESALELTQDQSLALFFPYDLAGLDRVAAIAAIQSMLDNPDDDALPVWPDSNITGAGK